MHSRSSILGRRNKFFLLHSVQTGYGTHPVDTEALSPGVKYLGHEADHSLSTSVDVKIGGAISPIPHTSYWHSACLIKQEGSFTFYPNIMLIK
jgi:hypothetical protein